MKYYTTLFLILLSLNIDSQNYLGLENTIPSNWNCFNGKLKISDKHYKLGKESIKWEWQSNSKIIIDNPQGMQKACNTYKGGMMLWIYNTIPNDKSLLFEYSDNNNVVQYYFNYNLNFSGWRACWIRFKEDMLGKKQSTGITKLNIIAPKISSGGTIYFDRMKFPSIRINDRVTPDAQLPYINPEMNNNHWSALWHWHSDYKYEIPLSSDISPEQKKSVNTIRQRITNSLTSKIPEISIINKLKNDYSKLNIKINGNNVIGNPFVSADEVIKSNNDKSFNDINKLLFDISRVWHHYKTKGFDEMYINILDWLYNQGFDVGSGMGTIHHYGYKFRNIPKSVWLMKDVLKQKGKFNKALSVIQYWSGVAEVRQTSTDNNYQGIMDSFNTILEGRLIAILLKDNSPELYRDMELFTKRLNEYLDFSPGTMGGIKPDGSGFHHGMHYGGYINGGYAGIGVLLSYLHSTSYCISDRALSNFKKALNVHLWTANKLSLLSSVSGRHPINAKLSSGFIDALGYAAISSSKIDKSIAGQYMRLKKRHNELYNNLENAGVFPALPPQGNISINYASLNIHRRKNWLVGIKGFNNIVTGTEIYTSNNRYGRYNSYGSIQILGSDEPVDAKSSGFVKNGWDWNRFPGTTTIHLPFEKLNYYKNNINERSLNEDFAGACSQDKNGIWAMKLHENNYPNYTSDFVARKSTFAFGNKIICIGSGISNGNNNYNTETTIFQANLLNTKNKIFINNNAISSFPYSEKINNTDGITLLDNKSNGYYIVDGNIHIKKANQESRNDKNKKVTHGNFASAWINHGKAPKNEGYEYVILPQTRVSLLNKFKKSMNSTKKPYDVISKNNSAHVVYDADTKTTAYVLFEKENNLLLPHIKANDNPCLIMVKELSNNNIKFTMCDPSLNMITPDKLVSNNKVKERKIKITIKGKYYIVKPNENCKLIKFDENNTILEFTCIHGLPVEVELSTKTTNNINIKNELKYEKIKIYPTPANNYCIIKSKMYYDNIKIFSLNGTLLKNLNTSDNRINVSFLKSGLYMLKISKNKQNENTCLLAIK